MDGLLGGLNLRCRFNAERGKSLHRACRRGIAFAPTMPYRGARGGDMTGAKRP
jgi:hypothetical protein